MLLQGLGLTFVNAGSEEGIGWIKGTNATDLCVTAIYSFKGVLIATGIPNIRPTISGGSQVNYKSNAGQ